jgi:hypothetical protein
MAKATFSLSLTAVSAHNPFIPKQQQIDDNFANTAAQEQQTMRTGASFLVLAPDGSLVRHSFDAERSIPGVLRVTRRV